MTAWEKEKAYCEKRANDLKTEMEAAIAASDQGRFNQAFQTAMRYMTRKQLNPLLKEFVRKAAQA